MNRNDITQEQVAEIREHLQPTLGYLTRLRDRMVKRRFPPDDLLMVDVQKACDAMQSISVRLHYLSCQGGTWNGTKSTIVEKPVPEPSERKLTRTMPMDTRITLEAAEHRLKELGWSVGD